MEGSDNLIIEIVAIGDEILQGSTVNTNAAFLSKNLFETGYTVHRHIVLSDEEKELSSSLKTVLDRNDIVLVTGGLGPTFDDRTKMAICHLMKTQLQRDSTVIEKLKERFQREDPVFEKLSQVPKTAHILHNHVGTAPGFLFSKEKTIIFMPGVPQEMEEMFVSDVLPFLQKKFPMKKRAIQTLSFILIPETDIEEAVEKLREKDPDLIAGIYPSFSGICLQLDHRKEPHKIEDYAKMLEKRFFEHVFAMSRMDIAMGIHNTFIEKKKMLAFAESCTGGALSEKITAIPGSSKYFLGSIVSYSNEVKRDVLGVKEKTLETKGAVSVETVEEMIKGLFDITQTDYGIAISGIAGPTGATPNKPLGTVCIAVGERGKKIDSGTIHAFGDRHTIIDYASYFALGILWRRVVHKLFYFKR